MGIPDVAEKWGSAINTVVIGATSDDGGTRGSTVTLGGASALPFLAFEGSTGQKPAIAVEIWDADSETWPDALKEAYGDAMNSPADWAKKAVEFGADLICLRLVGAHPDSGDHSAEQCAQTVKDVLAAVDVPLAIWGCGIDEKDNEILPAVSAAAKGENCLIGTAREKNYRTLVAVCLADNHKLIAESPLDINIAKQVNILCSDAGFDLKNIVMFPTTAALGYGVEYVYSIQERGRLAGLSGDKLLAQPVLCDVGFEAWRAKEARAPQFDCVTDETRNEWGVMWEAGTATVLLQAGAEVLTMRHPQAIEYVRKTIDRLTPAAE
ncbi:MAG: acetyl-CoA decarbonylase/synthase complex subunit delta [Phycisphaerae bacterium]|jgi:acetyl-CoA decarbonylase/synthase complex subunit delta|nr:acetyl-CoA decarbonylase/synthase complex subunit delta [Phycisphaerae bacterium]